MVSSKTRLFADDCLMYRTISSEEDSAALQEDLDQLRSGRMTSRRNTTRTKAKLSVSPTSAKLSKNLQNPWPDSPAHQQSQIPGSHHKQPSKHGMHKQTLSSRGVTTLSPSYKETNYLYKRTPKPRVIGTTSARIRSHCMGPPHQQQHQQARSGTTTCSKILPQQLPTKIYGSFATLPVRAWFFHNLSLDHSLPGIFRTFSTL